MLHYWHASYTLLHAIIHRPSQQHCQTDEAPYKLVAAIGDAGFCTVPVPEAAIFVGLHPHWRAGTRCSRRDGSRSGSSTHHILEPQVEELRQGVGAAQAHGVGRGHDVEGANLDQAGLQCKGGRRGVGGGWRVCDKGSGRRKESKEMQEHQ